MALPSIPFASAGNGNLGGATVTPNAALRDGDLREVRFTLSSSATCTTPSGWTKVVDTLLQTSRRLCVFQRKSLASDGDASFDFSATVQMGFCQFYLRDYDQQDFMDVNHTNTSGGSGTSLVSANLSTTRRESLEIISFHHITASTSANLTVPSGMTSLASVEGNGTNGHAVLLCSELIPNVGAAGTRTSGAGVSAVHIECAGAFHDCPARMMPVFAG